MSRHSPLPEVFMASSPASFRLSVAIALALVALPFASHPRGQTPATPSVAFAITKIPSIVRQVIPGDFTGDGRIDLIANSDVPRRTPGLIFVRGRGDGSFDPAQSRGAAEPLGAGDVNGDGRLDLVVRIGDSVGVLPGNGNGTFGTLRPLRSPVSEGISAIVGRFDSDAAIDIALLYTDEAFASVVSVYPGNGDFTFDAPITEPSPFDPGESHAADLNGDAFTDIVGAGTCCLSVATLVSNGAGGFSAREFAVNEDVGDVRAADLNGDGEVDLVVTHHHPDFNVRALFVTVIMDAFGAEERHLYDTGVPGEFGIALADFTGDGILDIATGNQSTYRDDDLGVQMWSSVSVLKGTITDPATKAMTFGSTVTFRLGTVNWEGYTESWNLETADLNRDGRLDLVHAPGAVLLNRPPVPNNPPSAFAGPDRTLDREHGMVVMGEASDSDGHWLDFTWSHGHMAPWFFLGSVSSGFVEPGVYERTLTVDDGQGGTSSDSVTITVVDTPFPVASVLAPGRGTVVPAGSPYTITWAATDELGTISQFHLTYSVDAGRTFNTVPGCASLSPSARSCVWQTPGPPADRALIRLDAIYGSSTWTAISEEFRISVGGGLPLPPGWQSQDIGGVGAPGNASTFAGGAFTVRGSGADIWGPADELHYAYRTLSGDFDVVARVAMVENVNEWTKAGLMLRGSTSPGSAHASLFATPTSLKGLSFQARRNGGGTSTEHARIAVAGPVWLKLSRRGGNVQGAWRLGEGDEWTNLPVVAVNLPNPVLVGFAVSSHVDSRLATATFDNFAVGTFPGTPVWGSADVGAVGAAGSSVIDGSTFTVRGSGADIWGTADELHLVSQSYAQDDEADFELTARVTGVENVDQWTKAGIMVRTSLDPGSAHASLFVTPTTVKGIAFQRRRTAGAQTVHTAGPKLTTPVWLKLTVRDGDVRAFYRTPDGPWTFIGQDNVMLGGDTLEIGLAVSSHRDGTLATATFDNVSFRRIARSWVDEDIGSVGVPGTTADNDAVITLEGSGADIWGTVDAFRTRWTDAGPLSRLAARVWSVENTNPWAKAGVMFREDFSAAGSRHVMVIVSPQRGVAMQYRGVANGPSANVAVVPGVAPRWVRIARDRTTFIGEMSSDGLTWTEIGRIDLAMSDFSQMGLVVTSHNNSTLATAIFDDVVVDRSPSTASFEPLGSQ
jgi:regulation of enolase protein 1 (concanavalin A-like superfamily)